MSEPTIQNFYSAAQKKEFARDFQFRVASLGPYAEDDLLYIKTATLPGMTLQNQQVPYMGLDFNVPGSVKYDGSDSWEVTFWCDEALNIRNKAEGWLREIFNDATSTGKYGVPVERATMMLLGKNLETIRTFTFFGIYLVTLGAIEYNKTGTGEPLEFSATLAYQYWREEA
jgi:hypothetical protein